VQSCVSAIVFRCSAAFASRLTSGQSARRFADTKAICESLEEEGRTNVVLAFHEAAAGR
jgi:hypothetical protein